MEVRYYINNIEVNPPINDAELSIEINFDKDDNNAQAISLNEFEYGVGRAINNGLEDASVLINNHRENGLNGGVGVFEGLPHRIEITKDNTTYQLANGYLDTSKALFECDRVIVPYMDKGNIDWLNEVADSASFAYMYEKTAQHNNFNFIPMPYVLSSLPDNKEALLATLSLAFLVETITTQLQELIEYIVGLPNVLDFLGVVKLILRIIYIVGLIIALAILIKKIINLLIQPVKYHNIMRVKNLCEIGSAYYGFTFKSSIFDDATFKDLVILPEKYTQGSSSETSTNGDVLSLLGYSLPSQPDSLGYYNGTFGQLLRALKEMFNGKIIIDGNILRFEREWYPSSAYNYILPPVDQTQYKLNSDKLKSNYVVEFQTDINDKNTLNNYQGTLTQVTTTPKGVVNTDMVLMTGLETRSIPFARATTKKGYTQPEEIIRTLAVVFDPVVSTIATVVDAIIETLETLIKKYSAIYLTALNPSLAVIFLLVTGKKPSLKNVVTWFEDLTSINLGVDFDDLPTIDYTPIGNAITERRGMLLMENDFVDVAKIFLIDEDTTKPSKSNIKIPNDEIVNSEFLYNNFHQNRTFVTSQDFPNGNQYKIYDVNGVPFCFSDYELLRQSNKMQDSDNRNGRLISCKWNVRKQTAEINYEINELYTNNLKQEIITLSGR